MEEIENAKIDDTMLGFEGHGILTMMFYLSYGGVNSSQGYGGYRVDGANEFLSKSIKKILQVVDVNDWSKVKGSLVRVKRSGGWNGKITAIGNILKDDWFSFEDLKKELGLL